jgi:hypothetical protein
MSMQEQVTFPPKAQLRQAYQERPLPERLHWEHPQLYLLTEVAHFLRTARTMKTTTTFVRDPFGETARLLRRFLPRGYKILRVETQAGIIERMKHHTPNLLCPDPSSLDSLGLAARETTRSPYRYSWFELRYAGGRTGTGHGSRRLCHNTLLSC